MRKVIFFIIGGISILFFLGIAGLLLPPKITIAKSVLISSSQENIKQQLSDFNNWKEWYSPMQDGSSKIFYHPKKEINSVVIADKNGNELQLINNLSSKETVLVQVISTSSSNTEYQFLLLPHGPNTTQVTLNVNTYFKWYPWEKIKGIFLDKISGQYYETALEQLKKSVERE